jgi:glycosyltransferase involved in cell wall biosynthesis
MHICHVTPHLPPDQAANALLPFHLGTWAQQAGDDVCFVSHPPRAGGDVPLPGPVVWIPATPRGWLARATRLASLRTAIGTIRTARPALDAADVVHLHSNGLLIEMCGAIARARRKPQVLTLYGTEIWHYRRPRLRPDLFTQAYREADVVTFYSRGLRDRARELGLDRDDLEVVYPPVAAQFHPPEPAARQAMRDELGAPCEHLLLNVKRLHPLAGQSDLIQAMPAVLERYPDTRLTICGTGPLLDDLQTLAGRLGVGRRVVFAGLVENRVMARYYAASDLFVLPSRLEACPTVALEALACGTPVVSTDNPGGVELGALFGPDVTIVPRANPGLLADAICGALARPRRTLDATREVLLHHFRPTVVARRYRDAYRTALARHS